MEASIVKSKKIAAQFKEVPVKCLLVDLDGTLLGNHGIPLSVDFIKHSLRLLRPYGGFRKAAKALWAIQNEFRQPTAIDETNDRRVVELFSKHMNISVTEARRILRESLLLIFPGLKKHFFPVEGAKEFLDWAQGRFPMTLATNPVWPPEIVELRVQWAGIDPKIFNFMTHIRTMHSYKPSPEYYQEILKQQDLKAEDCLLIGDDVKMDLPATQVGIRVFIVSKDTRLSTLAHPRAKAPAWRGSYDDLRTLLEQPT